MGADLEGSATQAEATPSLYERLGGVYAIAVVVDDFIDRIMGDPRLNANPRVDEAHHRVTPQGFKYYVTEQVCWRRAARRHTRGARCSTRTVSCSSPARSGTRSWTISTSRSRSSACPSARLASWSRSWRARGMTS